MDDDGETTWHIGTFEIPNGLTSMVGIVNIAKEAFSDGENQVRTDRSIRNYSMKSSRHGPTEKY